MLPQTPVARSVQQRNHTRRGDMKKAAPADWAASSSRIRSSVDADGRAVHGRFARSGPSRLTLLSKGGRSDRTRRNYHNNVLVADEPAPPR
jgi:hypothetical protein